MRIGSEKGGLNTYLKRLAVIPFILGAVGCGPDGNYEGQPTDYQVFEPTGRIDPERYPSLDKYRATSDQGELIEGEASIDESLIEPDGRSDNAASLRHLEEGNLTGRANDGGGSRLDDRGHSELTEEEDRAARDRSGEQLARWAEQKCAENPYCEAQKAAYELVPYICELYHEADGEKRDFDWEVDEVEALLGHLAGNPGQNTYPQFYDDKANLRFRTPTRFFGIEKINCIQAKMVINRGGVEDPAALIDELDQGRTSSLDEFLETAQRWTTIRITRHGTR
jgi:hypothetical protein